ncbi:GNAT family N-acetyltransferase [Marinilactibacillus sp. XAAS-LB27]|uniref:GNAT family N-acetyltransferase n=1 Tax=Marinilactibacillus sp. XAAS-LB27 TaxID=3114538 RepID=UPI002E17FD72|nr:GNAT family N-acetyltransferase [Marinilactibacillus sp. XAAS-LB27]
MKGKIMICLVNLDKVGINKKVKNLYMNEFPKYERYPFWFLKYQSKKKNSDFYVIYDDNEYVGLLYLIYYKDIVYILYLAINHSKQSKGYGSKILNQLSQTYRGKRLLLNIEKIDSTAYNWEQRIKRKKFYKKNDFTNTNFEITNKHVVYEILFQGKEVYENEYHRLFKSYLGSILYWFLS